jgi:tripartite-type tricarboxylate transporter receptor subunit TctC
MKKLIGENMKKLLTLIALTVFSFGAAAETIKLIVPFSAGSTIDTVARTLSKPLSEKLNAQVVVENKPGAGGDIANRFVATADKTSITLLINSAGLAANTAFVSPQYELNDLIPLVNLGSAPVVFVASKNSNSNVKNFQDYQKQDTLTYGSSGVNSLTFLFGELVKGETNKNLIHVPYKGVNQSLPDLISGVLDSSFLFYSTALIYINDDKVYPIGVTSTERLPLLPSVPTLTELGVNGVGTIDPWFSVFSNNTEQTENLDRVKQALYELAKDEDVRKQLTSLGLIAPKTYKLSRTFLIEENKKYQDLIEKYKLK